MEQHAATLAAAQAATDRPIRVLPVAQRLSDNALALGQAYRKIGNAVLAGQSITPAAEWLLDNYHIVEVQIRTIIEDLPPKYYRQLPKLAEGPFAGHPRIMGLVWAYIAHTDSNFEADSLTSFVRAYQRVTPLTIGELWATAITLRLMLVENLRRLADRIVLSSNARERANGLADRLLSLKPGSLDGARLQLKEFGDASIDRPFAVQLVQRLRDQDVVAAAALAWLEERLAATGLTTEAVIIEEHQRQSAANVSVRNIITSMRLISDIDWPKWVESVSLVDDVLRHHAGYALMDFATRNAYRDAIEELSRGSDVPEIEVARRVILAVGSETRVPDAAAAAVEPRKRDPGYYLIGGGRATLETGLKFRAPFWRSIETALIRSGLAGYLGFILALTAVPLWAALAILWWAGTTAGVLILAAVAIAIPLSDIALSVVNFVILKLVRAKLLPSLEFGSGIPEEFRTLCVIPTVLSSRDTIEEQVQRLETHFLADSEGEIFFALLTDWSDSDNEETPADKALLDIARDSIAMLNERYGGGRFLLCHRRRLWCESEGKWMGWERKRGKLRELNRLLRGAEDTSYAIIVGNLPPDVRFVVTLDSDTRLPRDSARRLAGKMAHPLNRPIFDASLARVVDGHAIMQPRVTPSLPVGQDRSAYQRVYSSPRGLDPYVFAVSDVYQDMFGEGSYTGKGIYDVDAFERALSGRVPDNTMLSHDLFEGTFARAALVSDVELVEDYPTRYDIATARQHRWVRGDWQLLPWIVGPRTEKLPALGLWKMVDNLRRSIVAPAQLASLFIAWTMMPARAAILFTLFVLSTLFLPLIIPVLDAIPVRHARIELGSHIRSLVKDFGSALVQGALNTVFLAHQAYAMTDAIVRTLYRLMFSRKHLLEWTPAAQLSRKPRRDLAGHYLLMISSPVIAAAAAILAYFDPDARVAASLALLWIMAPAIAYWLSLSPNLEEAEPLSAQDIQALRLVARRTWHFFETFVTPANNMLPPDNFQEDPKPIVARRTSPTNIGLYLLSVASARDFGWIGLEHAVERIEATLATLDKMERFKGHFFNWYATEDLRPLEPRYVSSVDSGNLAGHLIALANTCRDWRDTSLAPEAILDGIEDGLAIFDELLASQADDRKELRGLRAEIAGTLAPLRRSLAQAREAPDLITFRLVQISIQAGRFVDAADLFTNELGLDSDNEVLVWARGIKLSVEIFFRDGTRDPEQTRQLRRRIAALEKECRRLAHEMDFEFLLNRERNLLSIGYRASDGTLDTNCYDMLASEARLASFFAIAKGDVRTKHWFRLGRPVTAIDHGAALVSWSGSMFEYLMPSLVMRAPQGGILDQTAKLVVRRQISYARSLGLPWGMSESAFNVRDVEFTYQYSNFGVPGLGLKRGLSENAVIAPYATGLAAMVSPRAAVRNFQKIAGEGGRGRYGFYEALDYTPARVPEGLRVAIVKAYMAHHQGMTIVALSNAIFGGVMRRRFHGEPMIQAAELLLQERAPRQVPASDVRAEEIASSASVREQLPLITRRVTSLQGAPQVALLANADYGVMLTAAGSGYSIWRGLAITRWREDPTLDDWGSYVYIRDIEGKRTWSAGAEPSAAPAEDYTATFTEDRVEIARRDGPFTTTLECLVTPEGDAEVRRVSVTNNSRKPREIELTSYLELVLAPAAADAAHPAFSKLFVRTEFLPDEGAIIATRRKRSPGDPDIWAAHLLVSDTDMSGAVQFETDRAAFIGRGRNLRNPAALDEGATLGGNQGAVLDPIMSLRARLTVPARQRIRCAFWTLVAPSREALIDLIDRHRHVAAFERAAMLAWTQAQIQLRHLTINAEEAALYQQVAGHILYANPALRPPRARIAEGLARQSGLWPHGISGDVPIVLVRIDEIEDIEIVRQLLRAQEYWRKKHLIADLVILNDRASSYVQDLQQAIEALVHTTFAQMASGAAGNPHVFVLRNDLIGAETRSILPAVARVVFIARRGPLSEQLARIVEEGDGESLPAVAPVPPRSQGMRDVADNLEFFNGVGGFGQEGREYVTVLDGGNRTPAPWTNVVANAQFGFHCDADGSGYTWSVNSREYQLTPWPNDPVVNRPSEALYIRDDETGAIFSPCLLPVLDGSGPYTVRHGQGYSVFEHRAQGIGMELTHLVAPGDPVKMSRLVLRNESNQPRRLTVTAFAELALAASRHQSQGMILSSLDLSTNTLFFRNPWSIQFGDRVAFFDMGGRQSGWTADRREFLGRHGNHRAPLALTGGGKLSGAVGGGLDTCGVLQTAITLAVSAEEEIYIIMGDAPNEGEARALVTRYRNAGFGSMLKEAGEHWDRTLGTVTVKTPDPSMNILLNRWALYQTLACRIWGRAGYYQASGAYGFRDQLQDCLALLHTQPRLAREQILRAAARQFVEGDVQHWWLPPGGMGVRTHISDDTVWLIYCVCEYVSVTGDAAILDEEVSFLEGQAVPPGEHDAFYQPAISEEAASLYEHCRRALLRSMTKGPHGLPLIGTGDWNDGMNRVGDKGRGESVWLGWFTIHAIDRFAPLAAGRGDGGTAAQWLAYRKEILEALESAGWDGQWYRRGYFDDGTPLGSAENAECRIDSIAQTWAVISGAANPERARTAIESVNRELVDRANGIALLFTPPFQNSSPDPGYIQAYPPGIRENGGQYTHAANWLIYAFAALGDRERAHELFAMINPINHARDENAVARYKAEPYAVAADIYSVPPHAGRAGWTWYTGSAGWLYRAGLEAVLGLQRRGNKLTLNPCVPQSWNEFEIVYRFGSATYHLKAARSDEAAHREPIELIDDGQVHEIQLSFT